MSEGHGVQGGGGRSRGGSGGTLCMEDPWDCCLVSCFPQPPHSATVPRCVSPHKRPQALRSHLVEFRDHELVRGRPGPDGGELLYIPMDSEALEAVLAEMG